jgi:hypothetical protein
MSCEVTVLCLVRHGYATTAACLETLYASTSMPVNVVVADIASPPAVQRYLAGLAASREGFVHMRFDEYVTRQRARIAALARVDTPYVVLLDNNMLCSPGWLDALLDARAESGASVVSPIIVTHGGRVHFSAGSVLRKRRLLLGPKRVVRPHAQPGAPIRAMLADTRPRRIAIDFAESHCCLVGTDDLRLPGVLEPNMHNAHTACYASYTLKHAYGRSLILEPAAVVGILPIAFGYDLPWMCHSYMRRDLLADSYRLLEQLIGPGPGTAAQSGFAWHAKHLKYLLLSMHEGDRFERDDLLSHTEVPEYLDGYDFPLPPNADAVIASEILPRVERRYPTLVAPLREWLRG